ncbi:hypothetical protein [Methanolobus sp.]|jgi:hypothetical protein|uniref:COG1361 S-layer family protein n=1 Tax=Methanolobus sp. TaxID=1874737 RepID=UPI0025D36409|nr:hypothetical protein [Methanolobus sp.]
MNGTSNEVDKLKLYFIPLLICILLAATFLLMPSATAKEYISPTYEYTNNYYKAYGEPDIYASVLGDTEFERGETAQIRIMISNKGVLYGFKPGTFVETSGNAHQLSLTELQYETQRTSAYGIKAHLVSSTDLIEIDAATNSKTMEKLLAGELSENPFVFTVTISENAPAGTYLLEMPLNYEYPKDVRMTAGESIILGRPDLDHATYYETVEQTIQIPVIIVPEAKFEVSSVSGNITAGSANTLNITYTNIGELPAENAVARLIMMQPLSAGRPIQSLGTMQPGESRTVSFDIASDFQAVEKSYGIDSEIKYTDVDGEDAYSNNMKVNVFLKQPERKVNVTGLALAGLVIVGIVLIIKNTRKNGSKKSNK